MPIDSRRAERRLGRFSVLLRGQLKQFVPRSSLSSSLRLVGLAKLTMSLDATHSSVFIATDRTGQVSQQPKWRKGDRSSGRSARFSLPILVLLHRADRRVELSSQQLHSYETLQSINLGRPRATQNSSIDAKFPSQTRDRTNLCKLDVRLLLRSPSRSRMLTLRPSYRF